MWMTYIRESGSFHETLDKEKGFLCLKWSLSKCGKYYKYPIAIFFSDQPHWSANYVLNITKKKWSQKALYN